MKRKPCRKDSDYEAFSQVLYEDMTITYIGKVLQESLHINQLIKYECNNFS